MSKGVKYRGINLLVEFIPRHTSQGVDSRHYNDFSSRNLD
jgi:hypothetical protein